MSELLSALGGYKDDEDAEQLVLMVGDRLGYMPEEFDSLTLDILNSYFTYHNTRTRLFFGAFQVAWDLVHYENIPYEVKDFWLSAWDALTAIDEHVNNEKSRIENERQNRTMEVGRHR